MDGPFKLIGQCARCGENLTNGHVCPPWYKDMPPGGQERPLIREEFRPEEFLDLEILPYKKMFLSGVFGILIRERGEGDPHLCFEIISGDDDHWFSYSGRASMDWMLNLEALIKVAKEWEDSQGDSNKPE